MSLERFIQTVKGQNNFWQQNAFLTCSMRFFRLNILEQLEFKLEKNVGIQKPAGKVRKFVLLELFDNDIDGSFQENYTMPGIMSEDFQFDQSTKSTLNCPENCNIL